MTTAAKPEQLAQLIFDAGRTSQALKELDSDLFPTTAAQAYLTQQEIFRLREIEPGGWKIGSKSPTGPIQGSPLPSNCIFTKPVSFDRSTYAPAGLELEIAFRFNRDFEPRDQDYSEQEVLSAIGEMAATLEIVSSRFAAWPEIEPLTQLADLLNHGALMVGEFIPYHDDFNFLQPAAELTFNGESIAPATIANPAGDPRRLLAWLVNHHTRQGLTLPKNYVVTTGSFTGMYFAAGPGDLKGHINGLPPVSLSLV